MSEETKSNGGLLSGDSLRTIGLIVLLTGAGSAAGWLAAPSSTAQYVTRIEVKAMITELAPYNKDKPVIAYRLKNIEKKLDTVLEEMRKGGNNE